MTPEEREEREEMHRALADLIPNVTEENLAKLSQEQLKEVSERMSRIRENLALLTPESKGGGNDEWWPPENTSRQFNEPPISTAGGGTGTGDFSSMLGGGSSGQPWAADAQHMEGPPPPPMAQILGEGGGEQYEQLPLPDTGKKKRAAKEPDWGEMLGGIGKGIGHLGRAFGSKEMSRLGGGLQATGDILGSVGKFAELFGGEQKGESSGLGDTITSVFGGQASGGQGSAPSTSSADPSDDLQKAIEKLTDAVTLLIEKMGGNASPGVGGTQMPAGGSLVGSSGDMSDMVKQFMQIFELISTMTRILAMAA